MQGFNTFAFSLLLCIVEKIYLEGCKMKIVLEYNVDQTSKFDLEKNIQKFVMFENGIVIIFQNEKMRPEIHHFDLANFFRKFEKRRK